MGGYGCCQASSASWMALRFIGSFLMNKNVGWDRSSLQSDSSPSGAPFVQPKKWQSLVRRRDPQPSSFPRTIRVSSSFTRCSPLLWNSRKQVSTPSLCLTQSATGVKKNVKTSHPHWLSPAPEKVNQGAAGQRRSLLKDRARG